MAAGLGFKTFTTGEVLTAADTNGYLMQGVLVFASAAARDAAITSPQEGQCCYLKDTDAVLTYSGSAWVGFDDSNAIQNTIVDAKGDLITATAADTPARLAVGTNGQTLVADSTAATGLKWATASSGALTKITSGTFSNVATVDIDSVFSSTYRNYSLVLRTSAATAANDLQLQFRVAGPTTLVSDYYGSLYQYDRGNTLTTAGFAAASQVTLAVDAGDSANGYRTMLNLYFSNVGVSSGSPALWGQGINNTSNQAAFNVSGIYFGTTTVTGFRVKSSSSNITGDYAVYGLEN